MFNDRIGLEFLVMTPSNHNLRGRDSLSAVGKLADVDVDIDPWVLFTGVGVKF